MKEITKEMVQNVFERENKRINFKKYEQYQMPKRELSKNEYYGRINLPFGDGIQNAGFPFELFPNPNRFPDALGEYKGKCWRSIRTKEEFEEIDAWCRNRLDYVYMLSCLKSAATLGFNKSDPKRAEYTEMGWLVNNARERRDEQAVNQLVELACKFIKEHPPFGECDFVAAVPAPRDKPYDLPKILAAKIAAKIGNEDITQGFSYGGEKKKLKSVIHNPKDKSKCFEEKWELLKKAKMCYKGANVNDKSILLIDDLYQSGITMQYTAKVLQDSGADAVFGLAMEKSLRDTGN